MKRLLLIAILGLGAARAQDAAARPQDLASLVPADTLLLVQGDDLGGLQAWSKQTALGRIWAEPEMQTFLRGLEDSIRKTLQDRGGIALGAVGLEADDLSGIRVRDGGFAVVDAGLEAGLDLVFTLRFRDGGEKAGKILRAAKQALETFLGVVFEPVELRGRTCLRLTHPNVSVQTSPMKMDLLFLWHEDRLVFTTKEARMEQVLTAIDEGRADCLAKSPRFAKIRDRMGAGRHALLAYADVPALYDRLTGVAAAFSGGSLPPEVDATWKLLGMDAVEAFACADIPDGTGFRTEFAATLTERRGLFAWVKPGRIDHRFARYAPRDCLLYGAETNDLAGVLDRVHEFLTAIGEEDELDLLPRYGEALGVDLRRDLLESLGDRWGFFVGSPPHGGLIPDVAMFVTVKDRAKVDAALAACVERFDRAAALHGERAARRAPRLALNETEFRGRKIRFAEITDRRGEPAMVAPAWAFGDDFLVVGLYPQTVKHVFAGRASLLENAEFRRLQGRVPETSMSCTWLDTSALVAWLYNTAVPLLQGAQGAIHRETAPFGFRINLQDLPPAEVITKHLTGTMFYTAIEEDMIRTGFVSPFGISLTVLPVAAIAATGAVVWRQEAAHARATEARARAEELAARHEREAREARQRAERMKLEARVASLEAQIRELEAALAELERK